MEARVLTLDDVLRERQRWCVPVYQRHYEWETGENGQLTRLWEDIEEKAEGVLAGSTPYPHYIGAIIVAEPANQPFGTVRERLLVDGQQRITTFQLVLAAVRENARSLSLNNLIPVVEAYLFNDISGGMTDPQVERYKLWPSSFDRQLYRDMADNAASAIPGLHPSYFYKKGTLRTGAARIDFFLGHVLVAETAHEINLGKLAAEYQAYARKREFPRVSDEIAHIVQYVPVYKALVAAGGEHVAGDIARFLWVWEHPSPSEEAGEGFPRAVRGDRRGGRPRSEPRRECRAARHAPR
jgi:hypothetical protein